MASSNSALPKKRSAKRTSSLSHWPHQLVTKGVFQRTPRGLDFSDPGTGKTRTQVELYAERDPATRGRCLVVCPLSLMYSAWRADFAKFAPELTVGMAYASDREGPFIAKTDVVVINTDGVKWLEKNIHYLAGFDHLIIDELTYFKHPTSQRSKAMRKIAHHDRSRRFNFRYGMTGTPNPNGLTELWHQLFIIDDGKRLGDSFYKFRQVVQTPEQIGPKATHLRWVDKPEMIDGVTMLLSDITLYHEFEKVMTHVPPNHSFPIEYQLPAKLRKLYDKFEKDAYALLADGRVISAPHASSVRQRLLQLCSGAVYNGDGSDDERQDYELLDTSRYELIADLVTDRKHSVVFFNWRHQREQLVLEFKRRGIEFAMIDGSVNKKGERDGIVADFQSGNLQAVALHYKTGSHGLTLDTGEATICSSPIYEADYAKQMLHRIYRGAQDKVTYTLEVEATGTCERDVYERRRVKGENMKDFLQILQQRVGA